MNTNISASELTPVKHKYCCSSATTRTPNEGIASVGEEPDHVSVSDDDVIGPSVSAPLLSSGYAEVPKGGVTNEAGTTSVFGIVRATVRVDARQTAQDGTEGFERRITTAEIESSAGTFGDPSRFMQLLPGVVSDNDERNDFLVRGGNPDENLFIIDNIEIPSINQLALLDTTGGVCIDDR